MVLSCAGSFHVHFGMAQTIVQGMAKTTEEAADRRKDNIKMRDKRPTGHGSLT